MAVTDHGARATEYRARAAAEQAAGAATALGSVRDKHARAAQAWISLADAEDAREAEKARRVPAATS